jgi:hypothetical protein
MVVSKLFRHARTRTYQRAAMLTALLKRLEEMRETPSETYPLDAVERELILEALAALAKRTLTADGSAER